MLRRNTAQGSLRRFFAFLKFREVTAELPSHGMPADRAGYSFSIRLGCENQAEIDRLWEALGERGEHQAAGRG